MSGTQRVAAIAVAALVVVAVAVVLVAALDRPVGSLPDATDSPPASATPAPSTASGTPASVEPSADEEELLATLAEIEEQVIAIRGLEAADIGPPDLITRDELPAELEELFDEAYPPEERERDNLAFRALGLLEPDQDVAELQLQLLGDQVLGFYDDDEKRMVVVTDEGLDANAKLTYAHEYTHALQDAAFGLESLETDAEDDDDRSLALVSLIEGDATVAMLAWALANLSQQELIEIGAGIQVPDTTGIPSWMVASLQFPYTAGQLWAGSLAGDPIDPDFAEIDAAFGEPPDSTEQIIHLEAWDPREEPMAVEVVDLVEVLGDGWEEVDNTPIGEASISIMLQHFGLDVTTGDEAAAGWGGDRVRIATGPDDAFALAWRLAWDTPADAAEFAGAYESILDELPFPASVTELAGGEVLVAHASSDELLAQTVSAAD